jgi:hypothetical protein
MNSFTADTSKHFTVNSRVELLGKHVVLSEQDLPSIVVAGGSDEQVQLCSEQLPATNGGGAPPCSFLSNDHIAQESRRQVVPNKNTLVDSEDDRSVTSALVAPRTDEEEDHCTPHQHQQEDPSSSMRNNNHDIMSKDLASSSSSADEAFQVAESLFEEVTRLVEDNHHNKFELTLQESLLLVSGTNHHVGLNINSTTQEMMDSFLHEETNLLDGEREQENDQ